MPADDDEDDDDDDDDQDNDKARKWKPIRSGPGQLSQPTARKWPSSA